MLLPGNLGCCGLNGDAPFPFQSQSITVDRQLKRYHVPRIAFINKCDRTGANPFKVRSQLREKLGLNAVLIQIPMGLEDQLEGVIDLITMQAVYFEGEQGTELRYGEIPVPVPVHVIHGGPYPVLTTTYREELLEAASMFSDELAERYLGGEAIPEGLLRSSIRKGTL